jgi:flagellar biosynthesis/type III secretory pathway M-ring protein FliF/YscJ
MFSLYPYDKLTKKEKIIAVLAIAGVISFYAFVFGYLLVA